MASAASHSEATHLDIIAQQARDIAKLQVEIAQQQIKQAGLEAHNTELKAHLERNLETLFENEMEYALSLGAIQDLADTMKRLAAAVEVIASTATEQQRFEAKLAEMAEAFSVFRRMIVEYGEQKKRDYDVLAKKREEKEQRFKENLNKRDVTVVFFDVCESRFSPICNFQRSDGFE